MPAPAGRGIVTGTVTYTLDVDPADYPGLLHLKLVRSPHAHARVVAIDTTDALAVPGVHAVLTHEDAPATRFSTAQHELFTDDPDDTRILDDVVRHVGQRVAAVVAETVAAAEEGVRRVRVEYAPLPAVVDPEEAMVAGALLVHPELDAAAARVSRPEANVVAEVHSELGDVERGLAEADVVHEATYRTHRVQHAALETHCAVASLDDDGRLVVRLSTQVPFLARRHLARVLDLDPERVRVHCERVGGGFGGKQEVLTEDVVALATLRLGRPVQLSSRAASSSSARRRATRSASACARARAATAPSLRCTSTSSATPGRTGTTARASCSTGAASPSPSTGATTRRSTPTASTRTRCPRARSAGTGCRR